MTNLDALKAMLAKATPGPVRTYAIECENAEDVLDEVRSMIAGTEGTALPRGFWIHGAMTETDPPLSVSLAGCGGHSKENAALDAALRNAASALIAELEAARECIKILRQDSDPGDYPRMIKALAAYDAATGERHDG